MRLLYNTQHKGFHATSKGEGKDIKDDSKRVKEQKQQQQQSETKSNATEDKKQDLNNKGQSKSKHSGLTAYEESQLSSKISTYIGENKLVVFMKGTQKQPKCGFSNYVVQVFKQQGVKSFKDVDCSDEKMREAIKTYSNWPTLPQVYINQQFIGGCDIIKEMNNDGSLKQVLIEVGILTPSTEIV